MSREVEKRIDRLFDEAEKAGTCLVPSAKNDVAAIRRARKAGRLDVTVPLRGMFSRTAYWSTLSPTAQALHVLRGRSAQRPETVFCGLSSAVAYGLYVSYEDLRFVHTVGSCRSAAPLAREHAKPQKESSPNRYAYRLVRHQTRLNTLRKGTLPIYSVEGVRVTDLRQTVLDAARCTSKPKALALADSAQRYYGMSKRSLLAYAQEHGHGLPGIATARWAFEHMNGLSENGGESIARGVMLCCGFAPPLLQVELPDIVERGHRHRVDFYWKLPDGTTVVGELDGHQKLEDPRLRNGRSVEWVLRDERTREAHLSARGIKIMRFTFQDVCNTKKFVELLTAYGIPRTRPA